MDNNGRFHFLPRYDKKKNCYVMFTICFSPYEHDVKTLARNCALYVKRLTVKLKDDL